MSDLHGNAPDRSAVALILIDVVNDLEWPGAEEMFPRAMEMGKRISDLKARATRHRIPTIYVNDNFGRWKSDFRAQIARCLQPNVRGRPLVELLRPSEDDYFVLKPMHSGFFGTTLELLLRHLEARTLVLAGIAANNCVLFTANDAYMRDYKLFIPSDCVVSNTEEENAYALKQMKEILKATVLPAAALDFEKLTSSTFKTL